MCFPLSSRFWQAFEVWGITSPCWQMSSVPPASKWPIWPQQWNMSDTLKIIEICLMENSQQRYKSSQSPFRHSQDSVFGFPCGGEVENAVFHAASLVEINTHTQTLPHTTKTHPHLSKPLIEIKTSPNKNNYKKKLKKIVQPLCDKAGRHV